MTNDAARPGPDTKFHPPLLLGLVTLVAGVVVLFGWAFDIPALKGVLPSYVTMKPDTAVAFLFAGSSLVLYTGAFRFAAARPLAFACAGVTAGIGLLTLCQYVLWLDLSPGRMAAVTAGNFVVLGSALMLAGRAQNRLETRRVVAEAASRSRLEASEKRYRRLFEAARDGILILDADTGQIVDVNPFLAELTGYSSGDFLGKHLWDIGPFRDVAASKDSFAELKARKCVRYDDLPLKTRDGREINVEFVSNVYLVDGKSVIQCNIRDISERVQAERALGQSEERFRILFQHAADSILVLEMVPEGYPIIVDVNQTALRLLGWRRDELIGQSTAFLEADPDATREIAERLRNAPPGTGVGFEVRHPCKDGTIREFEASLQEIHVGPKTFGISIERDVTQRKSTEAVSRQQQKLESIGTLASGVAHEINNPLNIIMNYGQLLLDHSTEPARVTDFAGRILGESERMAVIVRDLLSFARHETETWSPAQMADIVGKTLSLVQMVLRKDQIAVECEIPVGLPAVRCRSQQIQQVLMNLLTNARDALNERYPKTDPDKRIRILVSTLQKEGSDWVRLTVEDHGGGIPPEAASRMFDPFFTTKGRNKGTGLGLSISHGIVQDHHGTIGFETEPGRGTRFHVDLQVDRRQPSPDPAHS